MQGRSSQGSAICYLHPDSFTEFILSAGRLSETEISFLTEFQELCRSKDITRTFLVASDVPCGKRQTCCCLRKNTYAHL